MKRIEARSCSESSCNVPFIRGFADVDAAIERLLMRGRSGVLRARQKPAPFLTGSGVLTVVCCFAVLKVGRNEGKSISPGPRFNPAVTIST
ncbi:hypothetical protein MCOR28_003299 [Pyricularia oryzae]|nr:hypothetical protein MCOR26_005573 [Pyricularia oryzae]KAI6345927.1 hypothetical protein MCOR28_003299 [Pyricularia oryzae]